MISGWYTRLLYDYNLASYDRMDTIKELLERVTDPGMREGIRRAPDGKDISTAKTGYINIARYAIISYHNQGPNIGDLFILLPVQTIRLIILYGVSIPI